MSRDKNQHSAGDVRAAQPSAAAATANVSRPSTVYLVGAGPGAADLLTLRAAHLLARADIVFHDALVPPQILALAEHAIKVAVGKRCGRHSTAQRFIDKRLIDAAHKHACVVRLKGGDPMLFGRAQEEIDALATAGIACEVVPGITAALAASADLRLPLTRRGLARNVTLVTPRVGREESASDWTAAAIHADTAAIYMGAREAHRVADTLLARGCHRDTPVLLVENASLPQMRALDGRLGDLARLAATLSDGPTLILMGKALLRPATDAAKAANAAGRIDGARTAPATSRHADAA